MDKPLDEARSKEIAQKIKSKARTPFDNAHKAALITPDAKYVQGFLATVGKSGQPIEHSWLELPDCIIDPTLPHLEREPKDLFYFPAQRISVKQLKAALEEAKEDYPEDDPLPIYGSTPYEYYGDVMLGGKEYQEAYQAAVVKCQEINPTNSQNGGKAR